MPNSYYGTITELLKEDSFGLIDMTGRGKLVDSEGEYKQRTVPIMPQLLPVKQSQNLCIHWIKRGRLKLKYQHLPC